MILPLQVLAAADGIVKDLGRRGPVHLPRQWWALPALVLATGPIYGAFMGSFSAATMDRWPLVLYAAVKVPLLIFVTTAVCVPGFFVLNTVMGLRNDYGRAMRAIFAGQAAMTVALASLGPITKVAYLADLTHRGALLFNAAMFTVATAMAQLVMFRRYRELTADPVKGVRHRVMLWMWVVLYVFVGIQMGWMLRPFVGSPGLPAAFFRDEPFSNAYVVVLRLVFGS